MRSNHFVAIAAQPSRAARTWRSPSSRLVRPQIGFDHARIGQDRFRLGHIQLVQGVTIEFQDSKCPDYFANSGIWGPQGGRIPFPNVVERMIELVRAGGPEAGREIRKMASSRWA